MNRQEAQNLVMPFLTMTEEEVYHTFTNYCDQNGIEYHYLEKIRQENRFLYIKGTRPDKVLLVSHVDTVFSDLEIKPVIKGDFIISGNLVIKEKKGKKRAYGTGIGADDRAGVATLWHLLRQNLGHSILLVSGEEQSGIGSRQFMSRSERAEEINANHNFAIEFDRHGTEDLIFYNVGTPEFMDYCEASTGYKRAEGTFSDICLLCHKMCGVNISVGYDKEHTCLENLNLVSYAKTITVAENWLRSPNLPKFDLFEEMLAVQM